MKKTTAQKTAAYRLPEATTPENLEMKLMNNLGTILTFGDRILAVGVLLRFQRAQLLRRCVPVHH